MREGPGYVGRLLEVTTSCETPRSRALDQTYPEILVVPEVNEVRELKNAIEQLNIQHQAQTTHLMSLIYQLAERADGIKDELDCVREELRTGWQTIMPEGPK